MPPQTQKSTTGDVAARFNALKHGAYATSLLLPNEDVTAFLRERRALFHNYRPQTKDEADLVQTLAEHAWIKRRLGAQQALFDAQLMAPEQDAAGRVCEPIAHQREHSGLDVSARWKRVETLWHRARTELLLLQKLRQQGLVTGAVKLPEGCYLDTDCVVYGPVAEHPIVPVAEEPLAAEADTASGSNHGASGILEEQQEMGATLHPLKPLVPAGGDARPTAIEVGSGMLPRDFPEWPPVHVSSAHAALITYPCSSV